MYPSNYNVQKKNVPQMKKTLYLSIDSAGLGMKSGCGGKEIGILLPPLRAPF